MLAKIGVIMRFGGLKKDAGLRIHVVHWIKLVLLQIATWNLLLSTNWQCLFP